MSELQLNIDSSQDMSWLIQAVADVACASEEDLTAMQSKKWYNHLWEVVTFSKDNQIRTANGVTNLAKLQDILVRVMVTLSQTSVELSERIKENSQEIMQLAAFDSQLLQALKKHIYGKHEGIEFAEIDKEKQKLLADLLVLSDYDMEKSENSKRYISAVMRTAGMSGIDNQVGASAVGSLTSKEQELLYRMIVTSRHLSGTEPDADSEIVDEISISPKRRKDIQRSILETAKHTTPDFFISIYEDSAYAYDLLDDNGIQFEDDTIESCEEQTVRDTDDFEEITLSSIMHIKIGETKEFCRKIIHVQAAIHCEGSLSFDTCEIHYGEKEVQDKIVFAGIGNLVMKRCVIEAHSFDEESYFISAKKETANIQFEDCKFVNCCSFLDTRSPYIFKKCVMENIGGGFISSTETYGNIAFSQFNFQEEPDFIRASANCKNVIYAYQYMYRDSRVLTISDCSFHGNLKVDERTEEMFQSKTGNYRESLLFAGAFSIENCEFVGVNRICSDVAKISNSTFCHCYQVVYNPHIIWLGQGGCLDSCQFDFCCNIGRRLRKNYSIKHCKFNNCYGELISSGFDGGLGIEWCDFNNWKESQWEKEEASDLSAMLLQVIGREYRSEASISFYFSQHQKEFSSNNIRNCNFNNFTLKGNYIIKGYAVDKLPTYVANVIDCTFYNCITEPEGRMMIPEKGTYQTLFNKVKTQTIINISGNCRGLKR